MAAWAILAFALTRDALGLDWKVVTTAGAWRQLIKYLWPEIHKWVRRLRWDRIGRGPFDLRTQLLTLNLKLEHGEAFAVASDVPDLIEGAHADSMFYVLDESKSTPDKTWDAVEGAFSGAGEDTPVEALALSISTPGEPVGRFYEIHARKAGLEDWWARHVNLEEAIAGKRVSREWAEQRKRQWGEHSAVYQNRVEGNFAASDEDSVIPLGWIEAANTRWLERRERLARGEPLPSLTHIGVDVAAGGSDLSVIARRHGFHISELHKFDFADTMQTTGMAAGILRAHEGCTAIVDVIGWGAGCCHRLREQFPGRVIGFNAGERSGELGFVNKRSEAWWTVRELIRNMAAILNYPLTMS